MAEEKVPPRKPLSAVAIVGWTGGFIGAGVLAIAIALSFGVMPKLLLVQPIETTPFLIMLVAGIALTVIGLLMLRPAYAAMGSIDDEEEPRRSDVMYGRHLVAIGFALLIDALVCSTIIAALAWSTGRGRTGQVLLGQSQSVQSPAVGDSFDANELDLLLESTDALLERFASLFGSTPSEALFVGGLFLLSTFAALLGALFYFATSMWTKLREPNREPFDRSLFWGGLWFRIGEAILFNFVIFLTLRYFAPDRYVILPLVAVMVGMFLKAGETLISGLANRVFAAFTELVPASLTPATVLKVLTLMPKGLPVDGAELAATLDSLAKAIEHLKGVGRVMQDETAGTLQVEYDPNRIGSDRIRHEVRMRGYEP